MNIPTSLIMSLSVFRYLMLTGCCIVHYGAVLTAADRTYHVQDLKRIAYTFLVGAVSTAVCNHVTRKHALATR